LKIRHIFQAQENFPRTVRGLRRNDGTAKFVVGIGISA
jgi:hypothetical protein